MSWKTYRQQQNNCYLLRTFPSLFIQWLTLVEVKERRLYFLLFHDIRGFTKWHVTIFLQPMSNTVADVPKRPTLIMTQNLASRHQNQPQPSSQPNINFPLPYVFQASCSLNVSPRSLQSPTYSHHRFTSQQHLHIYCFHYITLFTPTNGAREWAPPHTLPDAFNFTFFQINYRSFM
jgi:hypothetical protein